MKYLIRAMRRIFKRKRKLSFYESQIAVQQFDKVEPMSKAAHGRRHADI